MLIHYAIPLRHGVSQTRKLQRLLLQSLAISCHLLQHDEAIVTTTTTTTAASTATTTTLLQLEKHDYNHPPIPPKPTTTYLLTNVSHCTFPFKFSY